MTAQKESVPVPDVAVVRKTVEQYFPDLWPAVDLGLSTTATLLLKENANPTAVIYVGGPSTGKTTVANMLDGATVLVNGKTESLCYRSAVPPTPAWRMPARTRHSRRWANCAGHSDVAWATCSRQAR